MIRQALGKHLVVSLRRRGHEAHAQTFERIPGLDQVVGRERDMLNAFAIELHQELFDLPRTLGRFFVERNPDHAIGRSHRLGGQTCVFPLDIEVAYFAEVEQLLVEPSPIGHAPAIDVMGQVVDDLQACTGRVAIHAVDEVEVDVIDRATFFKTVDKVKRGTADALDRRKTQFHRARLDLDGLCAQLQGAGVSIVSVAHTKRHAANGRAMLSGEIRSYASGFIVQDQVDVALSIQVHILGAVGGHLGEAQHLEYRLQNPGSRRSQLDELKAHQTHRIVENISHVRVLICSEFNVCLGCRTAPAGSTECPAHCARGSHQ